MWESVYDDTDRVGVIVFGAAVVMAALVALRGRHLSLWTFWRGLSLACFVSTGAILIFAHALFGAASTFTAVFLIGTTAALLLLGNWRTFAVLPGDIAFCVFLAGTAASIALHGFANTKELVFLALALAAYPAGRVFAGGAIEPTFTLVTAVIAVIGAITTLAAIRAGYVDIIGKVFVFGEFGAAPLQFAISLAVAIAAVVARPLDMSQAIRFAAVAALPTAIIAAAMVRLSFVAMLGMLAVAAVPLATKDRKAVALIAGALIAAIVAGQLSRPSTAALFMQYAGTALGLRNVETQPARAQPLQETEIGNSRIGDASTKASCSDVDQRNTIEIRKYLLRKAFQLLPQTALIGVGLDRFMEGSCFDEQIEVHNSALQVAVEFGWPAAGAFVILILLAGRTALSEAPASREARFVLCALTFMLCMSLGHGRISRDAHLFLFLGYAVGLRQTSSTDRCAGRKANPL